MTSYAPQPQPATTAMDIAASTYQRNPLLHGGTPPDFSCFYGLSPGRGFVTSPHNFSYQLTTSSPAVAPTSSYPSRPVKPLTPRPCLKKKKITAKPQNVVTVTSLPPRNRQHRVKFADEVTPRRRPLEQVKILFELSHEPPRSLMRGSSSYRAAMRNLQLTTSSSSSPQGGNTQQQNNSSKKPQRRYKLDFAQPFADFAAFQARLAGQKVALESCRVSPSSGHLSGVVKVANLAFEKEVWIRLTCDRWATFVDRKCVYDATSSASGGRYDSFVFNVNDVTRLHGDVTVTAASQVQFCIRYRAGGATEHWDSNGGGNFTVGVAVEHRSTSSGGSSGGVELADAYRPLLATPRTYVEEPTPERSAWSGYDTSAPFY